MSISLEAGEHGFIHRPPGLPIAGLALTHGAGADCGTKLLLAVTEAFAAQGVVVYRYNLPFRVKRPSGPPHPSGGAADRDGVRRAVEFVRGLAPGVPVWAGGHSYGGRQSTMAAAEATVIADGLVLLSYPLHPPDKPEQLRTAHFPDLRTASFFVQGARDPFGSPGELRSALAAVAGRWAVEEIGGAGHDLAPVMKKSAGEVCARAIRFLLTAKA